MSIILLPPVRAKPNLGHAYQLLALLLYEHSLA